MKTWKKCLQYAAFCLFGIAFTMGRISVWRQEAVAATEETSEKQELRLKGCGIWDDPSQPVFGGGRLTMLSSQTGAQMLSCIIETRQGSLIVVDGGTDGDAEYLQSMILAKGGRVSAWLLTHPHYDHVGALHVILNQDYIPITIDHVYYSFADPSWYESTGDPQAGLAGALMNDLKRLPESSVHGDIGAGQEIRVDGTKITVLNSRYQLQEDPVNNSSIVYLVEMNGKQIMFLGDMSVAGGEKLIRDVGPENLHCDIVQMAHHGQNGVDERFYRILRPKICLWPTPQWLWDNDAGNGPGTGRWRTGATRNWMEKINVKRHYCIKDGDQVIE